ncbi:MAG TPA: acyltransferase [Candidatus Baltobacteraceae bacterium]|nr:acyltransferase [Candidatus Baltobacteraceae bacterium]
MESSIVVDEVKPRSHARRIPELDGFRAIAILGVMLGHLLVFTPLLRHQPNGLPRMLATVINHGWLGVDLFFLLSGFLITSILVGTKHLGARRYFGGFYLRRALRIWPLYFLMVAIMLVAYARYTGVTYFIYSVFFVANLAAPLHVPVPNGGGPLWSLAVEEQFYLIWPVLVLFLERRVLVAILIAIAVVEPIVRLFPVGTLETTWERCDGLALGALLALWFTSALHNPRNDKRLALAFVGVAVVVTAADAVLAHVLPGHEAGVSLRIPQVLCICAAVMTLALSRSGAPAFAALRLPFLIVTADFSYCLYLIHVPLTDAYDTYASRVAPAIAHLGALQANVLRCAVVFVVAYALAAFSRRYVELPFLNLGRRDRMPRRARPEPASAS